MSEEKKGLPEGWEQKTLGEVCNIQSGSGFPKKYQGGASGPLPFYKVSDMNLVGNEQELIAANNYISDEIRKELGAKIIPSGSVVFPKVGGAILTNKKRKISRDSCVDNNIMGLIPVDNIVSSYFLMIFMRSVNIYEMSNKANPPSITQSTVRNWPISLPPLPEQRRIVAVLDDCFAYIDKAIANTEQNLTNARHLFESHLNQIFTQKGEGWEERELQEAVDEGCSLSYGIVQPGKEFPDGLPVVRPTDLNVEVVQVEGLKLINPSLATSYMRTKLLGEEILLCVRGSTGTIAIAPKELEGANVTRGIVPIRFDRSYISQELGYFLLLSKPFQAQIKAGTYGAALMQINIRDLKKITIKVPPLKNQSQILEILKTLSAKTQRLEASYRRKLAALAELKQSLLQKAFAGELVRDTALKASHQSEQQNRVTTSPALQDRENTI